ncbi:MAG TPA: hypothetical protein ACFYD3_04155 [Candidatus Hypogeohydataceae bacterium YC41]
MKEIFHRLDDVGKNDFSLEFMLHCEELRIPLLAAVIPARLSAGVARFLRDSQYVTVLQHGFSHAEWVDGRNDEFPATRSKANVHHAIKCGRSLLEDSIGKQINGYVPPWNKTAQQTISVLEELGFSTISGDSETWALLKLQTTMHVINISIDCAPCHLYLAVAIREKESIKEEIEILKQNQIDPIGVMYHVHELKPEYQRKALDLIESLTNDFQVVNFPGLNRET